MKKILFAVLAAFTLIACDNGNDSPKTTIAWELEVENLGSGVLLLEDAEEPLNGYVSVGAINTANVQGYWISLDETRSFLHLSGDEVLVTGIMDKNTGAIVGKLMPAGVRHGYDFTATRR